MKKYTKKIINNTNKNVSIELIIVYTAKKLYVSMKKKVMIKQSMANVNIVKKIKHIYLMRSIVYKIYINRKKTLKSKFYLWKMRLK